MLYEVITERPVTWCVDGASGTCVWLTPLRIVLQKCGSWRIFRAPLLVGTAALLAGVCSSAQDAGPDRVRVITSYSIHYTKLYEFARVTRNERVSDETCVRATACEGVTK